PVRHIALVDRTVTVVVDPVADFDLRSAGSATVDLLPGHARRRARPRAGADSPLGAVRRVALVHRYIEVVVDAVADLALRESKNAGVDLVPGHARGRARSRAGSHAALRSPRNVVLVRRPVAVVVDAVAGIADPRVDSGVVVVAILGREIPVAVLVSPRLPGR